MSFRWNQSDEPAPQQARIKRLKRSGVRKLYTVAVVSRVQDTYVVLKALLAVLHLAAMKKLLETNGGEVAIVTDQKMAWILHGKSHGGTHPCNYCKWKVADGLGRTTVLRTPRDDQHDHQSWKDSTSQLSPERAAQVVKNFTNCIRPSLIADMYNSQQDLLIDFSRPMPLHLKLRNGNHVIAQLRKVSQRVYDELLASAGCVVEKYHQELEGGPITRVLNAAARLDVIIDEDVKRLAEEEEDVRPLSVMNRRPGRAGARTIEAEAKNMRRNHPAYPYIEVLSALSDLLKLVARHDFQPNLRTAAQRYRDALAAVKCRPTVMMHIIVDEVPRFCERHNCGLGLHSEEAAESMHYEENKFDGRWHVPPAGARSWRASHGVNVWLKRSACHSSLT